MSEEILLPVLSVFGSLAVATIVAWVMLNSTDLHSRGKH